MHLHVLQVIDREVTHPHVVDAIQRLGRRTDNGQRATAVILEPVSEVLHRSLVGTIDAVVALLDLIPAHIALGPAGILDHRSIRIVQFVSVGRR
ncbi:hypothetical protein D3C71_1658630 [compost metagenome]